MQKTFIWLILIVISIQTAFTQQYNIQWTKPYGITYDTRSAYWPNGSTRRSNVLTASSDGGYAALTTHYVTPGDKTCDRDGRVWVNKFSKFGGLEWQKCYGGTSPEVYDEPGGIVQAPDGNFVFAGGTGQSNGEAIGNHGLRDGWVVKVSNKDGNVVWAKCIGGSSVEHFNSIAACKTGGFLLAGTTASHDGDLTGITLPSPPYSSWLVKVDDSGNILWQISFGESIYTSEFYTVKEASDGNIIAAGFYGSQDQAFMVKLDKNGKVIWKKSYKGSGKQNIVDCAIDNNGEVYIAGITTSSNYDFLGVRTSPSSFLFKLSAAGDIIWKKFDVGDATVSAIILSKDSLITTLGTTSSFRHVLNGLHVSDPANNYSVSDMLIAKIDKDGNDIDAKCFGGFRGEGADYFVESDNNSFTILGTTSSTNGDFFQSANEDGDFILFKVGSYNTIEGKLYYDYNNNQVQDPLEPYFKNIFVISEKYGGYNGVYVNDERFTYTVDTGNIKTKVMLTRYYYNIVPVVHETNHNSYYNHDTVDFAIVPIPGIKDLYVSLSSLPARPGFKNEYLLSCKNNGTELIRSGQVEVKMDNRIEILSHDSAGFSKNGDTLKWNFDNLEPKTGYYIHIKVKTKEPPIANVGDTLFHFIQALPVAGDSVPADNIDTVKQAVIGSFDPNNKSDNTGGDFNLVKVANNEYLEYRVNFQNTGSDTAFNVVVRDTLDDNLDWSSLEMIYSSHEYALNINNSRYLQWTLSNIKLLDSTHNEAASHGYISYRIKPKVSVQPGVFIENAAGIYFDYNLPVQTNIAKTEITATALPVILSSFTAIKKNYTNELQWTVMQEMNIAFYNIERSSNGIEYKTIGKVNSNDNSHLARTYSFGDNNPGKESNYYRVKAVGKDGNIQYSPVRRIDNKAPFFSVIYPNPAKDILTLSINNSNRKGQLLIQISDVNGKVLFREKSIYVEGTTKRNLNVRSLRAGSYFVTIKIHNEENTIKFEKL